MKTRILCVVSATTACLLAACGTNESTHGSANDGGSCSGECLAGAGGAGSAGDAGAAGDSEGQGALEVIVVTSAEGHYWETGQAEETATERADITVLDEAPAQTWHGFGGAFTELGGYYLSTLSEADQERALGLLFGPEGARLAWGRIPIGGNDYVFERYTLDDTGDDPVPDETESNRPPPDPSLEMFSIEKDSQYVLPFIKAAQAVNPELRFWGVPWTPPVWMKTGYTDVDGNGDPVARASYYDGGYMKGDEATLEAHAQYFVEFVQAYEDQGVHVEVVAPQNDPSYASTYPSCLWDAATYTNFIGHHLAPALNGAGLDTRIMLGSMSMSGADQDPSIVDAVLSDPAAKEACSLAGVAYGMVDAQKTRVFEEAGLPVWVTEHRAGNYPWEPDYQPMAPNDMAYAVESWHLIRNAITQVGVTVYNAWHMVLDDVGKDIDTSKDWAQNSLLVNASGELRPTPFYYVLRHFSRYVEPGATVLKTSGGNAVAFQNPNGSLVVVLYNSQSAKTLTVAIGGKMLQFEAPGDGFATLVLP